MARTDDLIRRLISTHGTNDPHKIAAQNKILVLFEELGTNIWGYYSCINRIPIIHISCRLTDFQARFAIAHELGHHKLHKGINTPFLRKNTLFSIDKIEREANNFAVKLIIGNNEPKYGETKQDFLHRCGIPEEFHDFY